MLHFNMSKNFQYIIVILLAYLVLSSIIDLFKSSGMSEAEHETRLKYEILQKKTEEILLKNKQLKQQHEQINKNINVDSVLIWDADRQVRDSIRDAINPK